MRRQPYPPQSEDALRYTFHCFQHFSLSSEKLSSQIKMQLAWRILKPQN
uniref:Uncharacterized protein n=1 Tax=Arundo donax TaxID=35708 RepID=A0A0A9F6I0_ARUDO